jgi:hypothetical protein
MRGWSSQNIIAKIAVVPSRVSHHLPAIVAVKGGSMCPTKELKSQNIPVKNAAVPFRVFHHLQVILAVKAVNTNQPVN